MSEVYRSRLDVNFFKVAYNFENKNTIKAIIVSLNKSVVRPHHFFQASKFIIYLKKVNLARLVG